jgi:two-component system, OmpR family, phosphate regulon response regulator OmpR
MIGKPSARVLLIEDDTRLANMVRDYLGQNGLEVVHQGSARAGLAHLREHPVDIVLLDLMLPDADGLDVCRQIRGIRPVPVMMVTARGDVADRVVGLELGADDYLAKPFEARELLARVRAILRRSEQHTNPHTDASRSSLEPTRSPLEVGDLRIDYAARQVVVAGQVRVLTARQFDVLAALAEHAGRVLSREQLIRLLPAEAEEAFDRAIDVHIARIRQVIEVDPRQPKRILTVRGSGYQMVR